MRICSESPYWLAERRDAARCGDERDGDAVDLLLASGSQFRAFEGASAGADLLVEPVLALRESGLVGCCLGAEAAKDIQGSRSAGSLA